MAIEPDEDVLGKPRVRRDPLPAAIAQILCQGIARTARGFEGIVTIDDFARCWAEHSERILANWPADERPPFAPRLLALLPARRAEAEAAMALSEPAARAAALRKIVG